tara:strand:- start:296 stop:2842 length:2547 start_codon:yes stop_codon:yes gene_type:complete
MAKLFGESISKDVVKQLEQRESILATGARDSQHLRYLNEKTAWVRAISGINRIEPDTSEYSANMAKEFILSGGRLKWNAETKKFEPRASNINFGQQEDGRYSYTETLGIRPEPGITSFSITHKNRFGTIREANLSFVVWTRDDLLKAERLFLRPGAQVVVEWGNSTYVDNEGTVENIPTSDQYNEFFNTVYVEKIYEIINKTKKDSSYNYDGFLGLVTNFTWKYRMDGGYDCSISIVSRSAVLESLTLLKPLDEGNVDSYFNSSEKTSLLHYFISICNRQEIKDIAPNSVLDLSKKNYLDVEDLETIKISKTSNITTFGSTGGSSALTITIQPTNLKALLQSSNDDYVYIADQEDFFNDLKVYGFDGVVDPANDDREVKFRYISLRYLLAVINKAFVFPRTKDTDFPSFYLGQEIKEELIPDNTPGGVQTYKTFDQHVSLDPLIGILPKEPQFGEEKDKIFLKVVKYEDWATKYIPSSVTQVNPFQIIINNISKSIQTGSSDILDIHVNLNAVKQILDSYFSSDADPVKINVLDLVKKILEQLNNAFGNINSFDIDFNEDLQKYFLVDREVVNEQLAAAIENKSVELINVTGLRNTVSDISIESKITSELSSMIAISNQAPIVDEVNANQPLIDWNAGTKNRFVNKDQQGTVEIPFEEQIPEEFRSTIDFGIPETSAAESYTSDPILERSITNQPNNASFNEKRKKAQDAQAKEKEKRLTFFKELGEAYLKLNNFDGNFLSRRKYKSEFFDKAKGEGSLVYKKRLTTDNKANKRVDQGLIPLQLSVTLDGISGFRIGQVFKIGSKSKASNILPDVYDNYGFIITGIDSSIGTEGKWLTTLRAQTFRLD